MTDVAQEPNTEAEAETDLDSTELYANRELSWLDFNDRVLQLAEDERVPLLERAKFLAIFAINLDEFFMVRIAGVHDQIEAGVDVRRPDGLSPTETLKQVHVRARELMTRHIADYETDVKPALAEQGIRLVDCAECSPAELDLVDRAFHDQIFPALTPLA